MTYLRRIVTLAVVLGLGFGVAHAQPDEVTATMQVDSGGQSMTMEYAIAPGRMRMDMAEQQLSVVFTDNTGMLMIQHADRRYIEWGPDQMKMMQQMMQRMPQGAGGDGAPSEVDISRVQFAETGQTDTIGPWDAFEVQVTGVEGVDNEEMSFWMTADAEVGLIEVSQTVAEAASALTMPMAGGAMTSSQQFARFQSLAEAQGLPEGRVVRLETTTDGQPTMITLMALEAGPVPAETFGPPDGYEAMQMPSIPNLPE